jgi:predicted RNA-binding Zn-ribbon protein involved in translation (DUF1610 family)
MVVCPACGSSRIRHDYRPAPFYLRIFLVRALLCDHCNRQFRAFSLRMPGARQSTRPKRRADTFVTSPARGEGKIDLHSVPQAEGGGRVLIDQLVKRHQNVVGESTGDRQESSSEATPPATDSVVLCPECGSSRVKRRPRKPLERFLLSFTDHRAFVCRECQHSFYARPTP